ncbi:MAG: 2-succinyl-5-enolpyruvyl-6-hydroxy-3-cyclohexene-1-carboxylic-acid synthase [Bacteroidota bacterium]
MTLLSAKTSVANAVRIAAAKGIKYAVISPGSRNAPLTISLDEHPNITCLNIPDERVAGFFALGMAQELQSPVILCCTSGSAALNYAPAIVEAYYQKIPLLIYTADRPTEWIDQRAGQTMRQHEVYANYIKSSYQLLSEAKQRDHLWYNDRIINQAVDETMIDGPGPVHVNFPMREPLYDLIKLEELSPPKVVTSIQRKNVLPESAIDELKEAWSRHDSVLVIIGQRARSERFDRAIEALSTLSHVIILTENTSNVCATKVYRSIDRLIDSIGPEEYSAFTPSLVISCAGPIVSKKIRFMLRDMNIAEHWHVDPVDQYVDTYRALTQNVPLMIQELVPIVSQVDHRVDQRFMANWKRREADTKSAHDVYVDQVEWCDLQVMNAIHERVPGGQFHIASSTPVRYTQLFETRMDLQYRANRGVSGIDGCTSTAAGAAYVCDEVVTLVTGDIAFFYDSNAFWHHHVGDNLRVIMINNEGGNIFRYVKGPQRTSQFEKHFEAHHVTTAKGIAEAYHVNYLTAMDAESLEDQLDIIYNHDYVGPVILEIFTPRELNIQILKDYFAYIKSKVRPADAESD